MKSVLLGLLLLLPLISLAQDDYYQKPGNKPPDTTGNRNYYILLRDGTYLHGRIVRRDSAVYVVRLRNGQFSYVEPDQLDRILTTRPTPNPDAGRTTGPVNAGKRQYVITMIDGNRLTGEIIQQDTNQTVLRTRTMGEVRLRAAQIVRIEQVGAALADGPATLFPQTMYVGPTAFSAEQGRFYYKQYFVYVSQFEYGISDNWSVSTSFFSAVPTLIYNVSTKVSFPLSSRLRVGVNAQYIGVYLASLISTGIGYAQAIATAGSPQTNTTVGLGWTISNRGLSRNLVGTVGLVRQLGPKVQFISENLILSGSGVSRSGRFAGIFSAGVRILSRRHAFSIAAYGLLTTNQSESRFSPSAFGSYMLRFGK